MQKVDEALAQIKDLYRKTVGTSAPELEGLACVPFPPGVDPVEHVTREVRYLAQLSEELPPAPNPAAWVPPADSFATPEAMFIRLEIPGVAREDLKVLVAAGECVVRGERKPLTGKTEIRPVRLERPIGPFERRFVLPPGVRPEAVKARFADGLLELEIATPRGAKLQEMKIEAA